MDVDISRGDKNQSEHDLEKRRDLKSDKKDPKKSKAKSSKESKSSKNGKKSKITKEKPKSNNEKESAEKSKKENVESRSIVSSTLGARNSINRGNSVTFDSIPTAPPVESPGVNAPGVDRGSSPLGGGTPVPTSENRPQNNPANNQFANRPGGTTFDRPTPAPIRQFNNPDLPYLGGSIPRPGSYPATENTSGGVIRAPTLRPTYRRYPTTPPADAPVVTIPVGRPGSYLNPNTDSPTGYPIELTDFPTWSPTTFVPTVSAHPSIDYPFYINQSEESRYIGRPIGSGFSALESLEGTPASKPTGSASSPSEINRGSGSTSGSLGGGTQAPTAVNRNPLQNPANNHNASRPGTGTGFGTPTPAPIRQYTAAPNSPQTTNLNAVHRPLFDEAEEEEVGGALRAPTLRPTYRHYPTRPPVNAAGVFVSELDRPDTYLAVGSSAPSNAPSMPPSEAPSESPTQKPTTSKPSQKPTGPPTLMPTRAPITPEPTVSPTVSPAPTKSPSSGPTESPSGAPSTLAPTPEPTAVPTTFRSTLVRPGTGLGFPTGTPSSLPSDGPSLMPSDIPTESLAKDLPTFYPTIYPTTWWPTTAEMGRKEKTGRRISNDDLE
ncbi:unnamed protein product [Pseudo-nitzschia multistriata]|uniref:Uncharacterized protein n=1 Tax=Pseudo-nitzschia multistriata TaxID=183589 RepID=A0A448ZE75_9STRA|nr:unnamed protein product [Pseudo-nitzschia multistriata]